MHVIAVSPRDPAMTQFMIPNKCFEVIRWCRQVFLSLTLKLTVISLESDEEARARLKSRAFTFILNCSVRKIGFCTWTEDEACAFTKIKLQKDFVSHIRLRIVKIKH